MQQISKKRLILSFFFIFFLSQSPQLSTADTLYGEFQTGLIEMKGFHHPVYLYVPDTLKPDRKYPLVIAISEEDVDPKQSIEYWKSIANRHSLIVLAPLYHRIEDVPYLVDKWFFQIKELIKNMYPVNSQKVFLIGVKNGSQYAGYLGTNYADEFSAIALLGGSWAGKFEKLLYFHSDPVNQVPFYVALKADQQSLIKETEQLAAKFEKRGYLVQVTQLPEGQDYDTPEFKKKLLQWLQAKSEQWEVVKAQREKTFKEKVRKAVINFFTV
jgi:poly(3-hydroxybutyrate) depolymerase